MIFLKRHIGVVYEKSGILFLWPLTDYEIFFSENDLRVVRPMTYVREKDLRDFAEKVNIKC